MPTFALIAEGHTDQVVLDRIINLICSKCFDEELEVNFLQPLRDVTDAKINNFGGWELVFEYCKIGFDDALGTNDFVVIHVDTDAGEEKNFGLSLTHEGRDRTYLELIDDVRSIIIGKIGDAKFNLVKDRVIFAISVHSLESWLLLYFFGRDEPKNSFDRLNRLLRQTNQDPIVKEIPSYQKLIRGMKLRGLINIQKIPGSFSEFLTSLTQLTPK